MALFTFVLALVLLARPAAVAGPDPAYGEHLAAGCVTCHRPDGDRTGAIPRIAGMSYDGIVQALLDYRDGIRADPGMASVTRGLGQSEIEALAAHFSGAPPYRTQPP